MTEASASSMASLTASASAVTGASTFATSASALTSLGSVSVSIVRSVARALSPGAFGVEETAAAR